MYHRFDTALADALTMEMALYGTSDHSIAAHTARQASAENRVKAMNEATLGKAGFAVIHDTASTRYHEDAQLLAAGRAPKHHSMSFYLKMAETFRNGERQASEKAPRQRSTESAHQAPRAA